MINMNTYIWLNRNGEFLQVSESRTHTGHHIKAYFTKELNHATVDYKLPKFNDGTKAEDLIQVPAWAERKVFVGLKPDTTIEGLL